MAVCTHPRFDSMNISSFEGFRRVFFIFSLLEKYIFIAAVWKNFQWLIIDRFHSCFNFSINALRYFVEIFFYLITGALTRRFFKNNIYNEQYCIYTKEKELRTDDLSICIESKTATKIANASRRDGARPLNHATRVRTSVRIDIPESERVLDHGQTHGQWQWYRCRIKCPVF